MKNMIICPAANIFADELQPSKRYTHKKKQLIFVFCGFFHFLNRKSRKLPLSKFEMQHNNIIKSILVHRGVAIFVSLLH